MTKENANSKKPQQESSEVAFCGNCGCAARIPKGAKVFTCPCCGNSAITDTY